MIEKRLINETGVQSMQGKCNLKEVNLDTEKRFHLKHVYFSTTVSHSSVALAFQCVPSARSRRPIRLGEVNVTVLRRKRLDTGWLPSNCCYRCP